MSGIWTDLISGIILPRFRYRGGFDRLRARVTLLLASLVALVALLGLVALGLTPGQSAFESASLTVLLAVVLIHITIAGLIHAGQLRAGMGTMFAFLMTLAILVIVLNGVASSLLVVLVAPLIYSSLVWTWGGVVLILITEMALLIGMGMLQSQGQVLASNTVTIAPEAALSQTVLVVLALMIAGALSAIYAYESRRNLAQANRLLTQLRASAEVAQLAVVSSNLAEFMPRVVNYIRDRFGFYHVQIFLADPERRYANLVASTGDAGEIMLRRGFRLAIASQSAVTQVLQNGEPVVINNRADTGTSGPAAATNELLPDTRSEVALPLIVSDQVLGVLDIQSVRPNAFPPDLVESLNILAAQAAAATYNARQQEEQKNALAETRRLLLETEVNLREAQRLNQRLTGQAWEDYLKARSTQTVGYTLSESRLFRDARWTSPLQQAVLNRRPILTQGGQNRQLIAVPIELRGRCIGAIEIEPGVAMRQTEALEVLQALAQRLALSIDNARLFEQAQELAQRELEVNAISTNLQAINEIEGLARATLQELSRALGATEASIRIGSVEAREQ
ncbi:MAG: hypothetical protein OHK0023_19450 [Anaerolineae bacterium]